MPKTTKKYKTYHPKSLIDGARINQAAGTSWVAVPDKMADSPIVVIYGGVEMHINNWRKEAVMFKRFRDKFWTEDSGRPQYYTLAYFRFRPTSEMESLL